MGLFFRCHALLLLNATFDDSFTRLIGDPIIDSKALPALPVSILLSLPFYFLSNILIVPVITQTAFTGVAI